MYHLVELLDQRGELSDLHKQLLLESLPEEELYDLRKDPHELQNLADKPEFAEVTQALRQRVNVWIESSGDLGFEPLDPQHVQFFLDYRSKNRKRLRGEREALREQIRQAIDKAETR